MDRDKGKRRSAGVWKIAFNCGLLLGLAAVTSARAIEHEADVHVNTFYLHESSNDLIGPDEQRGEVGINLRPRLYTRLSENWRSFVSLQLFYASDEVDLGTDQFDEERASDGFAGLRQLWLEWGGLTDYPGEALRAGRERLRLDDGLVLDTDIVTARWAWDTTLLKGGIGVAEELGTFRSDDSELSEDEKNLRRIYGMLRWQYRYNYFLSAHVIDTDGRGNTVTAPQLTWGGLSLDNGYFDYRIRLPWQYYFTVYGVKGHETRNGAETDVKGWAFDGGMRWRSSGATGLSIGTQLTLTDDRPDGYRQTGLQSNRAYYLGGRSRMHRLNEALRADFRNLGIATAYIGLLPEESPWEIGLAVHNLVLRDEQGPFSARGYSGDTDGEDKDLGQAADLIISWYWDKDDNVLFDDLEMDSYLRLILSSFYPGEAFDADADGQVGRGIIDWVVKF